MAIAWNRRTTEGIITEAKLKYSTYDFTDSVYLGMKLPMVISCPEHGYFTKLPTDGFECQQCSLKRRTKSQTMTRDEFIRRSVLIHGDKYNYSLVVYQTARIKVKIICNTHGVIFEQTPYVHLKGKGCKLCANDKQAAHRKADNDHFIKRSVAHHGPNLFTYEKLDYKNAKTPVTVTCVEHGDFTVYPDNHWLGGGCHDCADSGGFSTSKPGILYVFHCESDSVTKIGITNAQLDKRRKAINKSYGKDFILLKYYENTDGLLISQLETDLIRELSAIYKRPNVKFAGYSESFLDVNLATLLNRIEQKLKVLNGTEENEESLGSGV